LLAIVTAVGADDAEPDFATRLGRSLVAIGRVRRDEAAPRWVQQLRFPAVDYPAPPQPGYLPHEFAFGAIVDQRGLIVACLHDLGEVSASDYWVWHEQRPLPARVKASDPWLDVAVLQVEAEFLTPVELRTGRGMQAEEAATLVGDPLQLISTGQPELVTGRIASTGESAPLPTPARTREGWPLELPRRDTLHHFGTMLAYSSDDAHRYTRGLLFDDQGRFAGLMTSYAANPDQSASGLVIGVDDHFQAALEVLKTGRLPAYGLLGIAPRAGVGDPVTKSGAAVEEVMPGTPAAQAGLRVGDVLLRIDDEPVRDDLHLIRLVSAMPAEAKVRLAVLRDTKQRRIVNVTATLSKKYHESSREAFAEVRDAPWRGMEVDFATASPTFRTTARQVDPKGCVAVIAVAPNTPAWKAGLRSGMFVSHVDGERVSTPQEFHRAVADSTGEVTVRLTVGDESEAIRKIAGSY
jgi:S1-C subfamily serine protease